MRITYVQHICDLTWRMTNYSLMLSHLRMLPATYIIIIFLSLNCFTDISRLDKSPLLANGYNAPPTHLNHMPFMQMGHAPMMSPGMPPHGIPRPDAAAAAAMMKNQNISGMDAITRQANWIFLSLTLTLVVVFTLAFD